MAKTVGKKVGGLLIFRSTFPDTMGELDKNHHCSCRRWMVDNKINLFLLFSLRCQSLLIVQQQQCRQKVSPEQVFSLEKNSMKSSVECKM